jgi:formimidoylglutamate deiminase
MSTALWAPRAWIDGRWAESVLLEVGRDGCWDDVAPGVPKPEHALALEGPALPGLVNAGRAAPHRA